MIKINVFYFMKTHIVNRLNTIFESLGSLDLELTDVDSKIDEVIQI